MISTVLLLPDQHRISSKQQYRTTTNHLKQCRTTITPLASIQYSIYAVTIVPFSCLPREAPSFLRTLRQVAHKLHGYIYTTIFALHGAIRHGRYIFMRSSTSFGHRRSSAPRTYIYIFCAGYLHHRNVTERQFLAQSERRKDNDHQQCFCLFFVFCFFFTVVCEQGLK